MMANILSVAVGGALGSVLRYLVGLIPLGASDGFPYKTLAINLVGSFLIGLIAAAASRRPGLDAQLVLLWKVGFCGGFTTFSSFALESVGLIKSGHGLSALLYIVLSVTLSVCAIFLAESLAAN